MPSGRIDVHAHYLAPAYVDALHARDMYLLGGIPIPEWSPELAVGFMDRHGIRLQMLSVSDPGVGFVEQDQASALARACNEYATEVVRARPERFGAFAVLPLPDLDAARAEASYCLDQLGHAGVGLLSSYGGVYLGDEALAPLLADLDQRGAWVMVHPTAVADDSRPDFPLPTFVAEFPFDTTRTAISLLVNGSLRRYPRIRWQLAHAGGVLPMLRARLEALCAGVAELGQLAVNALGLPARAAELAPGDASKALAGFFYDTALVADPPALHALRACAPLVEQRRAGVRPRRERRMSAVANFGESVPPLGTKSPKFAEGPPAGLATAASRRRPRACMSRSRPGCCSSINGSGGLHLDPRQSSGRAAGFLADPDGAAQVERPANVLVLAGSS